MQTRVTPRQEINRLLKDVKKYKQTTDREIKLLNMKIAKLQKIIEKNGIREISPDDYESRAARDFESKKKKTEFVPLDSLN